MDKKDEADIGRTPQDDDELGGPEPESRVKPVIGLLILFAWGAIMLGTILVPIVCSMLPTHGGSRSARIKWEQRQKEIRLAAAEAALAAAGQADAAAKADDGQLQTR